MLNQAVIATEAIDRSYPEAVPDEKGLKARILPFPERDINLSPIHWTDELEHDAHWTSVYHHLVSMEVGNEG